MWLVKARKVGNSLVITLPKDLEAQGWVPGRQVLMDTDPAYPGSVVLRLVVPNYGESEHE